MSIEREPIVEALDGVSAFITDVDAQLVRLLEAGRVASDKPENSEGRTADPEVVVPILDRLRTMRQRLAQIEAMAEREVTRALGTGKKTVAGRQIDVHGGWDRKDWQDREIGRLLAENALVDPLTGELDTDRLASAMPAVYKVLEAGRMSWRVTDLKEAGLDPDEGALCKREPKRMTVQFLTAAETA